MIQCLGKIKSDGENSTSFQKTNKIFIFREIIITAYPKRNKVTSKINYYIYLIT